MEDLAQGAWNPDRWVAIGTDEYEYHTMGEGGEGVVCLGVSYKALLQYTLHKFALKLIQSTKPSWVQEAKISYLD